MSFYISNLSTLLGINLFMNGISGVMVSVR